MTVGSTIPEAETQLVTLEIDRNVAVVRIDNAPLNVLSSAVRRQLLECILAASAHSDVRAVVIIGSGAVFIAGSDMREFDLPLSDPQLPEVIAAIERSPHPVVAAIAGVALGGGFELALGCDARVATPESRVGLPEATLGFIPGAGGTQRLPRLTGVDRAIEIICSGRRVEAKEALALGLVDAVATGDLLAHACKHALSLPGKSRVADRDVPVSEPGAIEAATRKALQRAGDRPNIRAAIDLITATPHRTIAEMLVLEREQFQSLRISADAVAYRHLFTAERRAMKLPAKGEARSVDVVGVIGAGTMGAGIATAVLLSGLNCILVDTNVDALRHGEQRIADALAGAVGRGQLSVGDAAATRNRLTIAGTLAGLSECDLIVEAVVEDLAVKAAVFDRLDAVAKPGAVLATNTSYLSVTEIAAATRRPRDVIGLHFFSPADRMRLLEVVAPQTAAPDAVATGIAFARRIGKTSVLAGDTFGFIGNRLYAAYRRQCEFMLEDGAQPCQIDAALTGFGFAMGPFAVADLSGLDIAWAMRRQRLHLRQAGDRSVAIPDQLCEIGRFGCKVGAGYYRYDTDAKGGVRDLEVEALVVAASAERGIVRRDIPAHEIVHEAMIALVNESALALADGAAGRADDIDVVMVNGYGFPRWRGGPIYWARQQDRSWLQAECTRHARAAGPSVRTGDVALLLGAE